MKNKREVKPGSRTCQTCEFNSKEMCIIHGEGYKSRKENNTCNDWSIRPDVFAKEDKRNRRKNS